MNRAALGLLVLLCLIGCEEAGKSSRSLSAISRQSSIHSAESRLRESRAQNPRGFRLDYSRIALWWDSLPETISSSCVATGASSNIAKSAYVGPESCKGCHQQNYASWADHPHRWMNALSTEDTVKGNFSGGATIDYLGGQGTFYKEGDDYRMRLERNGIVRVYDINQTIGSRFYQYYVGKQLTGPEPKEHSFYHEDYVLPFGYWLDRQEWVPVVHVSNTITNDRHTNDPYWATNSVKYTVCNSCHTTFAMGDRLVRDLDILGRGSPFSLHFSFAKYLQGNRPELVDARKVPSDFHDSVLDQVMANMSAMEAPQEAVTLGISCEACHFGLRDHVEAEKKSKPSFHPQDPQLFVLQSQRQDFFGKTPSNINWSCSRCHVGPRPQFAAGMATWNSTEASDAHRGSCYSQMTCVDCHNPHEAIGSSWPKTPAEDDAVCIKCHDEFGSDAAIAVHTHHAPQSSGSRCMNCHMPRVNEGLQDVIRTHMIHSPTNKATIDANHPNACNLCHTDKPINWTLQYLGAWYGTEYQKGKIARAYPDPTRSAALGWLQSDDEATRLVAADALTRQNNRDSLPELIGALDDPFLLNRQFARIGLERMLDIKLSDYGYRFYMTPQERAEPLRRLREAFR